MTSRFKNIFDQEKLGADAHFKLVHPKTKFTSQMYDSTFVRISNSRRECLQCILEGWGE